MKGLTDTITESPWEAILTVTLVMIDDECQELSEQWPIGIQKILGRLRHGIETVLSVLTTVFTLEAPRSRSLSGLITRITTKILAHTLSFFLTEILTPELSN